MMSAPDGPHVGPMNRAIRSAMCYSILYACIRHDVSTYRMVENRCSSNSIQIYYQAIWFSVASYNHVLFLAMGAFVTLFGSHVILND